MARSGGSKGILATQQGVVNATNRGFLPSMLFWNYKPLEEAENQEGDLVKVVPRPKQATTLEFLRTFGPSEHIGLRVTSGANTPKD